MNRAERRRQLREDIPPPLPLPLLGGGKIGIILEEIKSELGESEGVNVICAWQQPDGLIKVTLYPGNIDSLPDFMLGLSHSLTHPDENIQEEWHHGNSVPWQLVQ